MFDLSLKRAPASLDLDDLRRPVLTGLCLVELFISWVWILVTGVTYDQPPPLGALLPSMVMLLTAAFCLLPLAIPVRWRSLPFLLGMSAGFMLGFRWAPSPVWLYYQVLPIMVAGLLIGTRGSLLLAATITLACGVYLRPGATAAWVKQVLPAAGLLWATAITSWLATRNLYTALSWAMSSQEHSWEITKEARLRRGQLRRALHSLRTTYDMLKHTTGELEASRREAEDARQAKSRFVANISHELRTPLNIIVGFAEMLCTSPEMYGDYPWPPALREHILAIWRNAEHILSLVDDVLDLAQIEVSRLPVVPEPTDLAQLVRDALITVSQLLRDSGLELRVSLSDDLPMIDVDHTRIRQVLLNLINNAIRFTPQGYIEVGSHASEQEIVVYVRDSGEGIPEDKLDVIFDEFEQVDRSGRHPRQGVGLGLAISRHFVRLHGGRIWAESRLGEGSTFFFSLPTPKLEPSVRSTALQRTARPLPRPQAGTVIALGRDPLVVRMLSRYVGGSRVLPAGSLQEAAALVQAQHPQAVLVMADAPDMLSTAADEGAALLEAIAPFDVPIMVSSFPSERRAGYLLGVEELLIKPVMGTEVVSAIRRLCEIPHRILIVDDEPDMVSLLGHMVRQEWPDAEIMTATSGTGALALVGRRPSVMLLDLLMPGIGGKEVLEIMRSSPGTSKIPVVVITARGPAEELLNARRGEVHLLKNSSFAAAELVHVLNALMQGLPPRYATATADAKGTLETAPA